MECRGGHYITNFDIYEDWITELTKQGVTPPMYDKDSNNLTRKLEKKTEK